MGTFASVISNFGTYLAQRPASGRSWSHTTAHPACKQDQGQAFPQVTGPYLRFWRVGRLGLEPRTGGL